MVRAGTTVGAVERSHLIVAVRFDKRSKPVEPRFEVSLIVPPTPDGTFEHRTSYVRVAGRTECLGPGMFVEPEHAFIPRDPEKFQNLSCNRFQIIHQIF